MTSRPDDASAAIASLRRQYVAEALDGMIVQAEGALRFLQRGEDQPAEQALARLFDFARHAAGEMKGLRAPLTTAP